MYQQRLQHYAHIVTEEIKPQRRWQSLPEITRKQAETKALQERLLPGEQSILLDEQGQQLDSIGLSRWLENFHLQSVPQITFMVGGPYGVDCEAFPQQTKQLSLSPMTESHWEAALCCLHHCQVLGCCRNHRNRSPYDLLPYSSSCRSPPLR
ncbi:MAG: 23S rRNA (pseudouridine(1915)-N(3))-methyltransferase RlmH [bacterium]